VEVSDYEQIREEVTRRASKHVWCNLATIDRAGRPRSRIVHPVWEGPQGWFATFSGSHKEKHMASTPWVSCAYVDAVEPMYIDAAVTEIGDLATKERVWEFIKTQRPEPYGFDPGTIWTEGPGGANFGLFRLDPWRVQLTTALPGKAPETTIWRPA
jgi:hypothetical protein